MMPTCRSMDSYPYQKNQMPYPPCYYPGIEATPPQMKMDPPKPPFPYEQPWYYAGSYGHLSPMHFCCGLNNFPGCYSYRPPYPQAPVPSPIHYCGGYSACGEPFFAPYAPQPHYTKEPPRYKYDKYMPRDYHCCGCPNHPCHQREGKSVKIEEEEPDAGKTVNDALAPTQTRNYPYPVVWIPPEYTSNKEPKNASIGEVAEQDQTSHDRKPPSPRNVSSNAQEPRVWNEWLPFNMNSMPNMVHEGDRRNHQNWEGENNRRESKDERMNPNNQSEHKRSEFPFPIIWMPYYSKQEEGERENNQESSSSPKRIEEVPHTFKSVPVNSRAHEGVTNGTRSDQVESTDRSGLDATKEVTNEKIIPVKEVRLHQGKNESEGSGKRERIIPVKLIEENVTKKDSSPSVEKQSTSPRKNGKLPPVCLRVDPLPRKKNGNGSSTSPSPPASEVHSKATTEETYKAPSGMNDKARSNSSGQNAPNIIEKAKPKERTIPVSEIKSYEGSMFPSSPASKEHSQATASETSKTPAVSMNDKAQPNSSLQDVPNISETVKPKQRTIQVTESRNKGAEESCLIGDSKEMKAKKGAENVMEEANKLREVKDSSKPTDEGGKERKALSDEDAVVLIQAAYRGYVVRRWEPLKKLKQIAEVSKELTDVRGRIQAHEHSTDVQHDEKQKIAIGETIMRLLLKLDTIQGLHPSFREIRKSLARELASLQERLDSIMAKKSQQQVHEFVDKTPVEDTPVNTQNEEHVLEQQEGKAAVPREDSSESGSHDTVDTCEDQSRLKDVIASRSPVGRMHSNEGAEPTIVPNETIDECNPTRDLSETDKMVVEPEARLEADNISFEVDNLDVNAGREVPVGVVDQDVADHSSKKDEQNEGGEEDQLVRCTAVVMDESLPAMVHDSACSGEDSDIHPLRELPLGVLDEDTATPGFVEDDGVRFSKGKPQHEDVEPIVGLPMGVLDEDAATSEFEKDDGTGTKISKGDQQHGDVESFMELPVGLLDEDTEESEFPKPAEEGQWNAHEKTSPTPDATAKDTQPEQQQVEEQEEVQSSGESDGGVKVDFLREDGFKGYAARDIEVECEEETGNEAELPSLARQANGHELARRANGHELADGDECMVVNDDVNTIQSEPNESVTSSAERVSDSQREEEHEEKAARQEAQVEGQDIVAEQAIGAKNEDTETLAKAKTGISAAAPASKEPDVAEHDGGLNGDAKLLEENEKLRKMMKKLLDAGNEQLNVITDLTGRVKELEKKLERSKRVRTKRFRPATSKIRSNNPLQQRAIGVAM